LTTVIPKMNEAVEVALRRFRRAIESTGLVKDWRARTAYEKRTQPNASERRLPLSRDCASRFAGVCPTETVLTVSPEYRSEEQNTFVDRWGRNS
jgi:small subunit ribosomal protein S21